GAGPAGVDGEQPRSVAEPPEQVMKEDRMRLPRVGAPQEDEVRLLDLLVGVRSPARPEYRRQPGDAGRVSRAVAAVDVVAAEDRTRELLRDEVHLVRALGAAEEPERLRSVLADDLPKAGGRAIQRLVPRDGTEGGPAVAFPGERLGQPAIAVRHW